MENQKFREMMMIKFSMFMMVLKIEYNEWGIGLKSK